MPSSTVGTTNPPVGDCGLVAGAVGTVTPGLTEVGAGVTTGGGGSGRDAGWLTPTGGRAEAGFNVGRGRLEAAGRLVETGRGVETGRVVETGLVVASGGGTKMGIEVPKVGAGEMTLGEMT